MKASELRLGNLVWCFDKQVAEISTIGYDGCWANLLDPEAMQSTSQDVDMNYIQPIPLTKEWLTQFGFSNNGYGEFVKGRYMIDCEYTDKGLFEFCILGKALPDMEVEYVHQLQNLYFALTGKELTIE